MNTIINTTLGILTIALIYLIATGYKLNHTEVIIIFTFILSLLIYFSFKLKKSKL